MAWDILDIVTRHALGEEAVDALCVLIPTCDKGKWKRNNEADEGSSDHPKRKKNKF